MKKIICILFCLCVTVTGCSGYKKSSAVTAVTTGLSFTAEITCDAYTYSYFVEIANDGKIQMKSNSAQSDSEMDYIFENSTVTYIYNELEYSTDISKIPEGSVIDFIPAVLANAGSQADNVHYKNERYYISGSTEKYKFTLYLGESGLPLKITDSRNGISVIIKNPTIIS